MRIGIVAYWFNRGQAVVARQIRATLDGLGHETFVLARPTRKTNIKPGWVDTEGVWAQERVTAASDYLIPAAEYRRWAEDVRPDLVLFDQNYQFDEIAQLRESGVRTIGRFVWEHFADEHVEPAGRAFDRIYSLTACEQERYAGMGIETPRVRWGCFPDLVNLARSLEGEREAAPPEANPPPGASTHVIPSPTTAPTGETGREAEDLPGVIPREAEHPAGVTFLFPGGFMSKRKPLAATIEAFRGTSDPRLRLILKAQVQRQRKQVARMIRGGSRIGRRDRRIEVITSDLPTDDYLRMFAAADVCLAPSRWEGLGLHLFEATALGVPVITNDNPPMNEVVLDGVNGILVPGIPDGRAPRSGIPAYAPNLPALTAAIEALADDGLRAALAAGARRRREELSWERTTADLAALIGSEASG
ncbi:MAG TPA: glycosyltransferase family 4 protein [Solirubrobacterales bacterium]|jgi:glycosyltransferase involved in cell wall biosynthesis|nr:glycosyltransferase family 4 protein [Solirubrobacterales bacterium]